MSTLKFKYLIKRFFYYIFGEKFFKKFKYDWSQYPNRTKVLQEIIDFKKYNKYLEIGCDQNENFSRIKILDKIGVDPKSGGTHRMTSDEFFLNNKKKFDIIYIDGLHIYEQAIKDIKNSINFLNKNGIIVLHDCLPKKIWNQIVPQMYGHWNGDVWKAIVEARTWDNVDTFTIVADHGLGIILNKNNSDILKEKINNFKKIKFKEYYTNHKKYMRPIEYKDFKNYI